MLQRSTHILATLASLVAILVGLAGGWEFWAVVKRATLGYLGMYLTCGIVFVLGHLALQGGQQKASTARRNDGKQEETHGTDAAR